MNFARTCLVLSSLIWLMGTMVLCACPMVYFVSTVLAGLAAWKGCGKIRTWGVTVFIAAAVMTGVHLAMMVFENLSSKNVAVRIPRSLLASEWEKSRMHILNDH